MFSDTLFKFGKFSCQFAICLEGLAQLHERAHDCDVNTYGALGV